MIALETFVATLGMAGFAEGAIYSAILLMWIGLVFIAALLTFGLIKRSLILVWAAACIDGGYAWFFTPWKAFASINSSDPDVVDLVGHLRLIAVIWIIVSAIALAPLPCLFNVFRKHGRI